MISGSTPRLFAISRPLETVPTVGELIALADPHEPLLWVRDGRGCVAVGETLQASFSGPDRFAEAAEWWRGVCALAGIDDAVGLPGSGLIAFGSLAFADDSAEVSTLTVPRLIVARHPDRAWITEISSNPLEGEPTMPSPAAAAAWHGIDLVIDAADRAYLAGVERATARIAAGGAEKIVLARLVEGRIDAGDDLRVPLDRLASRYEDCWTFAVDGVIGASPETLIRSTEGVISARILAGTRARGADEASDARARDDLLGDPKEQHEHAYAVQSVITALGPHVAELDCAERPFALGLRNVWHLATDLRAVPRRSGSSLDLAGALHPTAAVAGTPTRVAVDAIAELEPFDRGRYAGAVGWIDAAGDGEWVIALRCARLGAPADGARTVTAYAGGGIMADSDPAREFDETVSKLRPIAEAFAP